MFNIITTAVKTVNIIQTQREKRKTSLGLCGERRPALPLSIIPGGYRSPLASTLGAQTAEPWGPNQRSWAQAQGLGIVWLSAHPHGSGSCVHRDRTSALCLQCVLSPRRFPASEVTYGPFSSPCGTRLSGLLLSVLRSENLWRCHINITAYHISNS